MVFDKRGQGFELGIPRINQLAVRVGPGASELQAQHSNRSATLPPRELEKLNLYRSSGECDSYEGGERKRTPSTELHFTLDSRSSCACFAKLSVF